jgi:hypothetical protein
MYTLFWFNIFTDSPVKVAEQQSRKTGGRFPGLSWQMILKDCSHQQIA